MEPGPLPPHERTWRHPSELGPSAGDAVVASRSSHGLALVVASGTLVVALIAVLVVTTTPRSGEQGVTLSATTMPPFVSTAPADSSPAAMVNADTADETKRTPTPTLLLASLVAIPTQVASAPQFLTSVPDVADDLPRAGESVTVQTDHMTYHCTWADLALFEMPDGAIVVDTDGSLVAQIDGGELVELAGFTDD